MAFAKTVPAVLAAGLFAIVCSVQVGAAQETTVEVEPVDVQEVPDDTPSNRDEGDIADALDADRDDLPAENGVDVAVIDPAQVVDSEQRLVIDTGVSNVQVSDLLTVAVMNQSAGSACPSNEYVFERDRPKWLFQTGRLIQAMKEGATVRVSFTCIEGRQSINALQFLSPPGAPAVAMPRRGQSVEAVAASQAPGAQIPLPANAAATLAR
ncbi:MAG: hypothetical protein AAGF49_00195 [Pseudomonadota bacterium]